MKYLKLKQLNRIALISITVAMLVICSSVTAFAADASTGTSQKAKVVYTGDGTTTTVKVEDAADLNTFKDLMPGETTAPQQIIIQNQSSKNMKVYLQAVPTELTSQALLNALSLKVTFKMDDNSAEQTLYEGPASGKTDKQDIVSAPIGLGFVYGKSESGVISAKITAPETMGNNYQLAQANIKWNMKFELTDPYKPTPSHNGGGDGGGGAGGVIPSTPSSTVPIVDIGEEPVPQVGPVSSSPAPEEIADEEIPLSNPPKTGQDMTFVWIAIAAGLGAGVIFILTRRKIKHEG